MSKDRKQLVNRLEMASRRFGLRISCSKTAKSWCALAKNDYKLGAVLATRNQKQMKELSH